ncbi:MAG: signal peptide peptidase SppA [Planctomycetaceae bacterium]
MRRFQKRFVHSFFVVAAWALTAPALEAADSKDDVKTLTYAHIELSGAYPEGVGASGLFGEITETLTAGLKRLEKAAKDDDLAGVILHINSPQLGWAKLNEFQQAVKRLRAANKSVTAWMESGTTHDYLLASACDRIVLPESGMLMLLGLRAEVTFYKNLFDMIGVQPEMMQVGEFKAAGEPYMRTEMSPAFRQEMDAILDDYYRQIVEIIAAGRKLDAEKVKSIIDVGLCTASQAKEYGLIDHVAYEDDIKKLLLGDQKQTEIKIAMKYGKKKLDADFSGLNGMINLMNLMMGLDQKPRKSKADKIAVINAVGPIMTGTSQSELFGGEVMGSTTMIKAIRQARDDETVKAIVLRIDSPGGSALASDLMWHELQNAKKPVIASMGNVAASGGYYIAMGAEKIFAEPGTLTGSIGVVGGKFAIEKLYSKIGITTTVLQRGKNSGVMSLTTPFSETERAAMQKMLDDIYGQFTGKAAMGRKMALDKLQSLAKGRVYTGAQAKELGLVDELGTLDDAVLAAKKSAGLGEKTYVERLMLPKSVSPFEQLLGPLDAETRVSSGLLKNVIQQLPAEWSAVLRDFSVMDLLAKEPALTVLPYRLEVK